MLAAILSEIARSYTANQERFKSTPSVTPVTALRRLNAYDLLITANVNTMNTRPKRERPMVRKFVKTLAASALAIGALTASAHAQQLQQQTITDDTGFGRSIPAFNIGVPSGWQLRSNIQWNPSTQCDGMVQQASFAMQGPGGERIEGSPSYMWFWGSLMDQAPQYVNAQNYPCPIINIKDAQGYIREYVRQMRPGARITSVKPRPDLAQEVRQAQQASVPPNMRASFEGVEAVITNADGTPERLVTAVVLMSMPVADMYGGMSGYFLTGMSMGVTSHRGGSAAQSGDLLERVIDSAEVVPAYEQQMAQVFQQRSQARQQAMIASSRNRPRNGGYNGGQSPGEIYSSILDDSHNGYLGRSGSTSAGQTGAVNAIREVTPYTNIYGETVETQSGHDRAFRMQDGSIYTTDDAFAQPWGGEEIDQ